MSSLKPVIRPLTGIFAMQTIITMAAYALPVIIPVAAADIGIAPDSIGFYIAIVYGVSMFIGLLSGEWLARFGATRLFQLMLVCTGGAALVLLLANPLMAIIASALLGIGSGTMNPAGSAVLERMVPRQRRASIFSIKQCATPAGGALAGALLPPLYLVFGWQVAMLFIPAVALVLIFVAPLANLGDRDLYRSGNSRGFTGVFDGVRAVITEPALRGLTIAGLCLATAQMSLATYLVVYLWQEVGFSEAVAGLVFSLLHISGIASRIVLGFVADRLESARSILATVCAVLALALFLCGLFTDQWPLWMVCAVIALAGASGNGWVGLFYAEMARLSPPGRVAEYTGAGQFFGYIGLMAGPAIFGTLLALTSSYTFTLNCLAALMVGVCLFLLVFGKDS